MTSPEVSNLIEQNVRIHDSLRAVGLRADLIRNIQDEPVAVMLPQAFDPAEVVSTIPVQRSISAPCGPLAHDRKALKNHFPLSGDRVYPRHVLDIIDITARAAADTTYGLAHELRSPTQLDGRAIQPRGHGLGLHTDYAGDGVDVAEGLPMHGLNVHLNWYGSYVAELGIVRRIITGDDIAEARERAAQYRVSALEAMYKEFATPFTETPKMQEGDILIFQAQQHLERQVAAVAHNFETVSAARRSDVVRPHLGHAAVVGEERQRLASEYKLHKLGYPS